MVEGANPEGTKPESSSLTGDRCKWLQDNEGMTVLAAQTKVMGEFPWIFRWNPDFPCDGSLAKDCPCASHWGPASLSGGPKQGHLTEGHLKMRFRSGSSHSTCQFSLSGVARVRLADLNGPKWTSLGQNGPFWSILVSRMLKSGSE